jgi:hypothetical protein
VLDGVIAEFALARGYGRLVRESAAETACEAVLVARHAG